MPSIVATVVLLLLQLPPPVVLASVALDPTHVPLGPVIDAGTSFTVTTTVRRQPLEML